MIKFSGLKSNTVAAEAAYNQLIARTGKGKEYTGWLDLPNRMSAELDNITSVAQEIRNKADILLICGIGGSYLGARAGIEFVKGINHNEFAGTKVYFVGNTLSSDYFDEILKLCEDKSVYINVISKSGTTLEPAIAFKHLRAYMEQRYGAAASTRIIATTDANKGELKSLATEKSYKTFVVPDDVGGRYSMLSAVGLLPLAVAGCNISALLQADFPNLSIPAIQYASARNALYNQGKNIEILASYEPSLRFFAEWWKQLFGESEGKSGKGIFPASVEYTADLHSMGQLIQDGERNLFETVLKLANTTNNEFTATNECARLGVQKAHIAGGVPNLLIETGERNEETLGELVRFFELSCAISAYIQGANPFDQPGVEAYKKEVKNLICNLQN